MHDAAAVCCEEALKKKAHVAFWKNNSSGQFVWFYGWDGWLYLGNDKSDTFGSQVSHCFVRTKDITLTGEICGRLTCCRLVSVQHE